jgi:hypothetical protein
MVLLWCGTCRERVTPAASHQTRYPHSRVFTRTDISSYVSIIGPKAAAFHPWGPGRLFIVTDAKSQFQAEEQALAQCNKDPIRKGEGGSCFLYAAGDRVVLPQRQRKPIASRK